MKGLLAVIATCLVISWFFFFKYQFLTISSNFTCLWLIVYVSYLPLFYYTRNTISTDDFLRTDCLPTGMSIKCISKRQLTIIFRIKLNHDFSRCERTKTFYVNRKYYGNLRSSVYLKLEFWHSILEYQWMYLNNIHIYSVCMALLMLPCYNFFFHFTIQWSSPKYLLCASANLHRSTRCHLCRFTYYVIRTNLLFFMGKLNLHIFKFCKYVVLNYSGCVHLHTFVPIWDWCTGLPNNHSLLYSPSF